MAAMVTVAMKRWAALDNSLAKRCGVAVSSGAACASGSTGASPVLRALGHPEPAGGVRITLGPDTDDGAIDAVIAVLPAVLEAIRLADTP